jgi:hypothetical protein
MFKRKGGGHERQIDSQSKYQAANEQKLPIASVSQY